MELQNGHLESNKISVKLKGALNRTTVPEIRKGLLKSAKQTGIEEMEIDLSDVSNLDTAGIALMVEVLRVLSSNGGRLHLTGLNQSAVKMIRLSRLDSAFDIGNLSEGGS